MKTQTTKKIFAFIIMMMFFSLTQYAFSQNCNCPAGYTCTNGKCKEIIIWSCSCLDRGYGCNGNKKCLTWCGAHVHCGVKVIDRKTLVNDVALTNASHLATQSNFTPIAVLESDNSSKLFESKKSLLTLKDNSQTQLILQREWGNADAINSTGN